MAVRRSLHRIRKNYKQILNICIIFAACFVVFLSYLN